MSSASQPSSVSRVSVAITTDTLACPDPTEPLRLAQFSPFLRAVLLTQTYVRWFWSARKKNYRKRLLRSVVFCQALWRYKNELVRLAKSRIDDRDRFPLLKGQCRRCLPIIASFREYLISHPDISQTKIAHFVGAVCLNCRTLVNSMERWRPTVNEQKRRHRDNAVKLCQALLRIKQAVGVREQQALLAVSFKWSNPRLLWRIVLWIFHLQKQIIRSRWKARRSQDESCSRCMPIIAALLERACYVRNHRILSKYSTLCCPHCKLTAADAIAQLRRVSVTMLRVAALCCRFVVRALQRARRRSLCGLWQRLQFTQRLPSPPYGVLCGAEYLSEDGTLTHVRPPTSPRWHISPVPTSLLTVSSAIQRYLLQHSQSS